MLKILIPESELFNEEDGTFTYTKSQELVLEHSLVSLSKWESKWCTPFLSKNKTPEQTLDYIRCMTLTQNVDPKVYLGIPQTVVDEISKYIDAPMTATTFSKDLTRTINKETVTSEIIYYWMSILNINFECQKWHLNRLLTFIEVCNIKNQPPKKMGRKAVLDRNRTLNSARLSANNTKG